MRNAEQLYEEIEALKEDSWQESEAYKELKRRLEKKSIKVLEEEGYKVPNWKRNK